MEALLQHLTITAPSTEKHTVSPLSPPDVSMSSGMREHDGIGTELPGSPAEHDPCQTMVTILDSVDTLEDKSANLYKATNWEYWRLGDAYSRFCFVSTYAPHTIFHRIN